jgi:hypothetical protein
MGVDARRWVQEARAPLAAGARRNGATHLNVVGAGEVVAHIDGWEALAARGAKEDDGVED